MVDGDDLSAKVEVLAESKPVKIIGNLNKVYTAIALLVAFAFGARHFLTSRLTETSVRVLKAFGFSIMACSSLGIGITAAFLIRFIFWRKRGLKLVDAIFGTPIAIALMFHLWNSFEGIFDVLIVLYGFGFFLITVLYPFLHKVEVVDYTQPPPWQGALPRFWRWLRVTGDIWSAIKPHTEANSEKPSEKTPL